jgi:GR25 family glycosyltransferase involved in LPS biosynthesis
LLYKTKLRINKLKKQFRLIINLLRVLKLDAFEILIYRLASNFRLFAYLKLYLKLQLIKKKRNKTNRTLDKSKYIVQLKYINLKHRVDRFESINKQLSTLGWNDFSSRFNAIADGNGAIGCAKSHILVLEEFEFNNQSILMVCEDDVRFNFTDEQFNDLVESFVLDVNLDVLLLGFNTDYTLNYSDKFNLVLNSQTTSCYLLKNHMKEPLLTIFNKSFDLLSRGISSNVAAIDQIWKSLQWKYNFVTPKTHYVTQIESYSDIEGKIVKYDI